MNTKRAFTLIELLVVIAIIAILAAILFPVFAQAKISAKKTASISNQKQYLTATKIYLADYDDQTVIIQYNNTYRVDQGDAAIGQIVNPYLKNMSIHSDPNSPIGRQERITVDLVDPATLPPQWRQQQTDFNLAIKSDYGYNTQYFSPMGYNCSSPNGLLYFKALNISDTQVASPADTILFINSIWDRTASGSPRGGGNWGLDMPCRRYSDNTDSLPPVAGCQGRWWWGGWQPQNNVAWNQFGGAWPYHAGKAVVGFNDSHAKVMSISQTTAGCDVRASWAGFIFDKATYIWDIDY
jgi:prepilin-type N-terminal cleavage/methylation domain-containing protein